MGNTFTHLAASACNALGARRQVRWTSFWLATLVLLPLSFRPAWAVAPHAEYYVATNGRAVGDLLAAAT